VAVSSLVIFISLALLAEVLGTVGGFGSSLFFVPVAAYFLDFHSVLGITAVFHVFSNLTKISLFRHGFDKKLIVTVGIPAVVCVTIGAFFSRFVNSQVLQVLLAVFLVGISAILMTLKNKSLKPTLFNSVTGGAISGLVAGLLGSGGAVRGLTLSAFRIRKEVFIATSAVIDLGVDLSRSVVYFSNGYIHGHDLYLILILLIVSIAGTLAGKKILTYFNEAQFQSFVLVLILLIGVGSLTKLLFFKT
jgi:uncharacterized membrane protein YfcA